MPATTAKYSQTPPDVRAEQHALVDRALPTTRTYFGSQCLHSSTMRLPSLRSALVLCLGSIYVLPSCAISVYLHPTPPSPVPTQLDAGHANFALARHLGLERFERIGEGDGTWNGALQADSEGLIGSAPRDGLLISMNEEDAKGECVISRRIHHVHVSICHLYYLKWVN